MKRTADGETRSQELKCHYKIPRKDGTWSISSKFVYGNCLLRFIPGSDSLVSPGSRSDGASSLDMAVKWPDTKHEKFRKKKKAKKREKKYPYIRYPFVV